MRFFQVFGPGSDRATGSGVKWKTVLLGITLLWSAVCAAAVPAVQADVKFKGDLFVVENDSLPLKNDFGVGRFGTGRLSFDDPIDLAVDEDDNVYILDAGNYRVQVMNYRGRHEATWGSKGSAPGKFDDPIAMAYSLRDEVLYILDRGTFLVHKFDLDGNFIEAFGEEGTRKGRFEDPVDLTVDGQGYVYVLDRERLKVLKFHKSGQFIDEWGRDSRKRMDSFQNPITITFMNQLTGYIVVADKGRNALFRFARDGDDEGILDMGPDVLPEGFAPARVETDEDNNLFILDEEQGKLLKLEGSSLGIFTLRGEGLELEQPAGLVLDSEDRIYITDLRKNRLYRFLPETE
jgi:sugar lactone lactonase YvrE